MLHARSSSDLRSTPVAGAEPIDRAHLFRMTLGDHRLEREVLQLFERQAAMLSARMRQGEPATIAALAHTLDGSARGIGAWPVSRAAQAVEDAVARGENVQPALAALNRAVEDAVAAIAELLRVH